MSASIHATLRAFERYGVEPTPADWRDGVLAIMGSVEHAGGPALLLSRLPHGHERWLVRVAGVAMAVVYDPETACVVTALPDCRRRKAD